MKKNTFFLVVPVMLILFTCAVSSPKNQVNEKGATTVATNAIPDDLKVIFKNSCMDCHATGGKGMAMSKVNFSDWDNYPADKQAKKAEAICKIITKGSMPPKSYGENNPDAIPTAAQKEMICKWSKSLAQVK
jgi:cytochrome c5